MPVFSQEAVAPAIEDNKTLDLAKHVQNADTGMINADGNKGSVNLSMAYANAQFGRTVLSGLAGRRRVKRMECKSDATDLPGIAQKVVLN